LIYVIHPAPGVFYIDAVIITPGADVAIRILYVGDDESLHREASRRLSPEGVEVELASDGRAALTRIEREPFDLVILDIDSPFIHGMDILRCIKTSDIDVVPLVLTAANDLCALKECVEWGTSDYLLKPFTVEELLEAIDVALAETVSTIQL
jgi:DNA-binding response OmpR family regulator